MAKKPRFREFFAYARARHECYIKKQSDPNWTTKDPILYKYRFTNVFRELDKTTVWFRENVREPLRGAPEVLLATVVFRMFNRIEVGEAVFLQMNFIDNRKTAFELFADSGDTKHLKRAILGYVGKRGPYVTGAYIISTPPGLKKLDGALAVIGGFYHHDWDRKVIKPTAWRDMAHWMQTEEWTLSMAFDVLAEVSYFGLFHSYEIVTDLRHTALLENASDVNTWANVGPGAARGLNRVYGRAMTDGGKRAERVPVDQMLAEMREMRRQSRDSGFWPYKIKWELRDVEHTLCEFDKYERVRLGQGRPRGVYR